MATATEITDVDLAGWAPGTKFYSADDGTFFVINADLHPTQDTLALTVVQRPTVLLFCTATACATDLVVDTQGDPGTTHEDLLAQAGYALSA